MTDNHHPESYSDSGFWEKLTKYAKSAGSEVVEKALTLYYVAADSNTPASAKAIIYGALGYFIFPVDIISDFIPVVGYTDDTVALAAAVKAMVDYTEQDHIDAAKEKIKEWFG
ncbi:YkvA family protein [Oceanobacter sp. 3_MG-2023]|uniref:YkvA family protein n=1 Tax=Oceanobacter sp. 3_MG-2023 TaxID=3062622 RepID=UPI0027361410|nr:YkvA family protein [Oceanobacter sp. 3_MG-2023]MDP2506104.1 YkvA family protein [Oceanobacter sp. 3_MG-2023]